MTDSEHIEPITGDVIKALDAVSAHCTELRTPLVRANDKAADAMTAVRLLKGNVKQLHRQCEELREENSALRVYMGELEAKNG